MRKLFLLLIIFIGIITTGCIKKEPQNTFEKIKEKDSLIAGVKFDAKPFGYIENGELQGIDIDIAKQIAKTILDDENKVEFIEVTSENRISKLMGEEVDVIVATMTDTEQRRNIVDFSKPYYVSGQAIMCKKNSKISSMGDLLNNNTVVVRGTTAEKTLHGIYNAKSKVHIVSSYKEAFFNVANSDNTCFIADEALLKGFVMDNPDYVIFNKKITVEPYAVATRKDEKLLMKSINHTIEKLEESGQLEKIIENKLN